MNVPVTEHAEGVRRDGAGVLDTSFSKKQMRSIGHRLCTNLDHEDVIYKRRNRIVIRVVDEDKKTFIVKMWSRPGVAGVLRRLSRTGSCDYEWRHLCLFQRIGVPVPAPLGFCRLAANEHRYTDALFMEDLGVCTSSTEHVKRLIRESREDDLYKFEQELIDTTAKILEAGLIDTDHGLVNTLVKPSGKMVRLDLEMVRWVYVLSLAPKAYGRMLGHLLATYTFAIQPDVQRTVAFAERVKDRLDPPRWVLRRAKEYVVKSMAIQREKTGIDTRVELPW